ncbi:hypothetical protein Syun_008568 [Stephania yunnanensis]|uniref:Uncharacterized protein n=1 Tax=Stephania yunnanensis TaxID=152371 RepID=A0AAP0KEV2_9MAGN
MSGPLICNNSFAPNHCHRGNCEIHSRHLHGHEVLHRHRNNNIRGYEVPPRLRNNNIRGYEVPPRLRNNNIHGYEVYEVPPRLRNNGLRRNEVPPRQCRSNSCRDEMSSRQQDFKIVPSSAVEISFDIYEDIITQPPTPIRRSFEWSKEAMLEYVEARNSQFSLVQDQETEFYTISNQPPTPGRRSTIWSKEAILEWLENQETDIGSVCQDEYEEEDDIDRCP